MHGAARNTCASSHANHREAFSPVVRRVCTALLSKVNFQGGQSSSLLSPHRLSPGSRNAVCWILSLLLRFPPTAKLTSLEQASPFSRPSLCKCNLRSPDRPNRLTSCSRSDSEMKMTREHPAAAPPLPFPASPLVRDSSSALSFKENGIPIG